MTNQAKPFGGASVLTSSQAITVSVLKETIALLGEDNLYFKDAQPGEVILVKGIPFLIVTDEEANTEEAHYMCRLWTDTSASTNDVKGICCVCRRTVRHSASAPPKAKKICDRCADSEALKKLHIMPTHGDQ